MSASARIAAFVATLAVVFAAALWVGNAIGPDPTVPGPHPATGEHPDPHPGHGS
ncbi:hypothetical protein ACNUDN_19875 [Mycobacterium sp. smrl_JER01]|uniref:hypothetical protein n=1 Tax=Mycobacterium sp. smrl_JER01 TaxID=3402633 RepID=UPI003AD6C88A